MVFDLNRFKQINDTHGHTSGDRVLRLFGAVARETLRKSDIFGWATSSRCWPDTTEDEAEGDRGADGDALASPRARCPA